MKYIRLFPSLILILTLPAAAGADDWPRWRGPDQDGISTETDLLDSWPEGGPPEVWRTDLGIGFSGVIVADGNVCTQFSDGKHELLVCFDAATGTERWRATIGKHWKNSYLDFDGPRATPAVAGGRIYAGSAHGAVHCLDLESGDRVWSRELAAEMGAKAPLHGYVLTPLIDGGRLYLNPGGKDGKGVVALNKDTGETHWTSLDDPAAYAAPIAIDVDGRRQIVFFTARGVVGVAAKDGAELWRYPWKTAYDINAATPIYSAPYLFIASEYDHGSALLKLSAAGGAAEAEEVWVNDGMQNKISTSVLVDGHLYGFHRGFLVSVELATGEERWRQRGFGTGSVTVADGKLLVLGDKGQLALAEISPAGYREVSRADGIVGGKRTWTVPTVAGGRLYLRDEEKLVCLDLRPVADG
ncbi:MAG: PQQ-binding-like beta-propeller repeat protein [Thermoanaerobaculia bacterium]